MLYNVAMIPYTNMSPYWELGEPQYCRFMGCVPSKSVAELKKGSVIAAAVPVGGLPTLKGLVEPIGQFGIGVKKESQSVLFFSDKPFCEINASSKIYLTDESASSVRLLYLLFSYRNGVDSIPYKTENRDKANGELIIGDAALVKAGSEDYKSKYKYVTDLGIEWNAVFKLPFVFARWVIRKDVPLKIRTSLENWLSEFRNREQELIKQCIPKASKKLNLPIEAMKDYFSVIRRILDNEDIEGQAMFLQEIQKNIGNKYFCSLG